MEKWATMVRWWERPEDAHAITQRVERLLHSLAAIDPVLSEWESPPAANSNSRTMIRFDAEYFERVELLQDGRSRRDDNGAVIEENGFSASILTPSLPGTEGYTKFTMRAGKYGAYMSPNFCSIKIDDACYPLLRTVDKQCMILRALVEAWDPDFGFTSSLTLLVERNEERRRARPKRAPDVGWLTYLPMRRGPIPQLAPPALAVSLGKLGSIIVASPERVSVAQPETIAAVDAVEAQLAQAGLLEPEPPRSEALLSPSR